MTKEQAIREYTERFGWFPNFLLMGATDEYIVWQVQRALRTGEEIESESDEFSIDQ